MARTARFPVPVASAALQMFLMTAASGMGRDDDASVARMYARVTDTHLPGEPKKEVNEQEDSRCRVSPPISP